MLSLLGGYIFTYFVSRDQGATAARVELTDSTVKSLQDTNAKREAVGLPPVDIDAIKRAVADDNNPSTITDAVTLNVIAALETDPRFRGAAGAVGPVGPAGEPCLPTNPACVGPEGKQGTPGAPGIDGTNGQNGADGQNGTNGTNGTNGSDGQNGAPGKDAPTIDAVEFRPDGNGGCEAVLTMSNGGQIIGRAGQAACDQPSILAPP